MKSIDWSPISWQSKAALQQPTYPDPDVLNAAVDALSQLPPLVTSWEIETLRHQLAQAARGNMFLLQGGDCAETFAECETANITAKTKTHL